MSLKPKERDHGIPKEENPQRLKAETLEGGMKESDEERGREGEREVDVM